MRASGIKRPTPVGSVNPSPASAGVKSSSVSAGEPAPENDPIGITLQYRESLGGVNNQITDIEA